MNKGSRAKAVEAKPVEPKNAPAPTTGKVFFGYTPAGRKGPSAKKG
jgi:hypothetical protein